MNDKVYVKNQDTVIPTLLRIIIISCLGLLTQSAYCQELNMSDYEWKNRVVLVLAEDNKNEKYHQQIKALTAHKSELSNRKLLIIEIQRDKYRVKDGKNTWIFSRRPYVQYSNSHSDFQVLLVGLDGGIKERRTDIFSAEELFQKIDAMPMRLSELRSKKKN